MKAVQVRDYGGSDMLALADVDIPQPGDGEALVNISRAGINFIDVYMRSGVFKNSTTYPNVPPFTPGMEAVQGAGRRAVGCRGGVAAARHDGALPDPFAVSVKRRR